ncbi:MAG TPA: hypothetical protein VMT87_01995 [Vicinamibacteria bacterium]|nr:hypothetical protein [Vicinamibacteria bacterium]
MTGFRAFGSGLVVTGLLAGVLATSHAQAPPVVTSLTLFAGSAAGLWRSGDWGSTWVLARPGAVNGILPLGPRVYACGQTGVLVSEDFGQSWSDLALDTAVLSILPSRYPLSDPTVFAGTASGLLKSDDGGKTFGPTALAGTAVHRLEWPGPALVLATGRGVLVSMDAGSTFTGPGEGLPPGEARALALSSFFAVDPVLFAGIGARGVFRSNDGGRSWAASGLADHTVNDLVWLGPILYAATDQGLFRSEDAGLRWSPLGEGIAGRAALRLMFPLAPQSGAEIFLGTDQGVFRTADGGHHWMKAGLAAERVLSLATFPPPAPVLDTGKRKRR